MKELEFKIYDKQTKEFLYKLPETTHLNSERYVICQDTGLRDENNKRIYHYDIIFAPEHREEFSIVEYDTKLGCYYLEVFKQWKMLKTPLWKNFGSYYNCYNGKLILELQVVCSLYENEELLELLDKE